MNPTGAMPARVTPFNANNRVNFYSLENHMMTLHDVRLTDQVPCNFTYEYFSISSVKRDELLRLVEVFINDDQTLIADTNAPDNME